MTINATFIGQIIVFLILLWVIAKYVTPAMAAEIDARNRKIADGLAAAEKGQKDLAEATTRADAIVREARERAKQIEDQAARRSTKPSRLPSRSRRPKVRASSRPPARKRRARRIVRATSCARNSARSS